MTKVELEQEAIKTSDKKCVKGCSKYYRYGFQNGYITGAESREKRIAELEETCNKWFEHLKSREEELLNELNNQNFKYNKQIEELEKENADLKEEINKIAFARGNLEEENAELKKRNAELKGMYAHSARESETYKQFLELKEKENAELKEKVNILDNCDRLGDVITEAYKEQLTKAKEIILRLYNAGRDVLMCRAEEKAYDNLSNAINDKSIEQFISEVEKCM